MIAYLREGIIGTDLIDAIPDNYDNGDAAGANHTRFGRVWELAGAASGTFGGAVRYLNYSIAGTNSDDSYLGMNDPQRRAAWANDGGDVGIILDGMNSRQVGVTLLFNRIRQLIDVKYAAGAKAVIVWGCSRPNDIGPDVENFLKVNRVLRQAAMTPGWGGRTAAFIDPTLVSYGDGAGTMGIVPHDYCLANGASHPGIRQHRVEGELGRKLIFGLSSASRSTSAGGFVAPALLGSWAPFVGESQPGYLRDGRWGVLKGLVRGGAGGIFNLPRSMWPPEDYNIPGNNGIVRIGKDGVVSGSASPIGLDGVRYWIG
ncbi:hypothetical protein [Sphingomonas melonis]|uniref:SGNH hydrolase-type esterase domain-containing protein n=1 Tax=Sphingomonas melonis TaxID=152682 RepID=A0A7Y9FQ71_9SPHN|nr:hypothetical protein [Sphingomonas melonis]NYD91450.1 hypothetical protein [Sphingomonas melonis]